jgi:hypothetical protein
MTKREIRLLALLCTFIGIVLGFFIAPIKEGQVIYCGNNSANNNSADIKNSEPKKLADISKLKNRIKESIHANSGN